MTDVDMGPLLLEELASVENYLQATMDILKSGAMPDITGLESRVAALCQKIQAAEKDIQKQCLSDLSTILQRLDECENGMRTWKAART